MNSHVAAAVLSRGELSGSIITVATDRRMHVARQLVEAGSLIHADVFGAGYDLMEGASDGLVTDLSRAWPALLDIHIMARDAEAVLSRLDLASRVRRISVHVQTDDEVSRFRSLVDPIADELWVSVDAAEWSESRLDAMLARVRADGVLEMLAPAGVPGQLSDVTKIDEPSWAAARRYGPLGVDGGVGAGEIDRLANAGVGYFVVGRALLE